MNKYEKRIYSCAKAVQIFLREDDEKVDRSLWARMVAEGLRKAHDVGKIDEINKGKYKGHRWWSKSAYELLVKNNFVENRNLTDNLSHEHVVPLVFSRKRKAI